MNIDISRKETEYNATGLVYGYLWGGGSGSYPSNKYSGYESIDELKNDIQKDLESGALDSGMGFNGLIGAVMEIETVDSLIDNNGERYTHSSFSLENFGDLTEEIVEWMTERLAEF